LIFDNHPVRDLREADVAIGQGYDVEVGTEMTRMYTRLMARNHKSVGRA
jgi:hypothetical protein